jgi:hypothetical protein
MIRVWNYLSVANSLWFFLDQLGRIRLSDSEFRCFVRFGVSMLCSIRSFLLYPIWSFVRFGVSKLCLIRSFETLSDSEFHCSIPEL